MSGAIQKQLNHYLRRLQREQEERGAHPGVISMYTDAIGRCYDLLGEHAEAAKYFSLAAETCLENLTGETSLSISRPYERGNEYLTCARILWRARDVRAKTYFQQALEEYRKGYDSELEGIRINSWHKSIYCLIFLEDYEAAMEAARTSYAMEQSSEIPHPGSPTKILMTVIENCQKGGALTHAESISILEELFKREKRKLYGQRPAPIADIYEFVKRKLAELEVQD